MKEVITIRSEKDMEKLHIPAKALREGKIVAFPTETVYGLGANALNPSAVKRIFELKKRPPNNPLIIHIADRDDIKILVEDIPPLAEKLIDAFFPGPLALVLKKSEIVPPEVTGGGDTVAVRMPDNRIALFLIKNARVPVVAPSANLSGRPSPTKIQHILDDFGDKIDFIINGGEVKFGVESTVLDLTGNIPEIIRPGALPAEEIEKVAGPLKRSRENMLIPHPAGIVSRHYSPSPHIIYCSDGIERSIGKINEIMREKKAICLSLRDVEFDILKGKVIKFKDTVEMARKLYTTYRELEKEGYEVIFVDRIHEEGIGFAVMDRVRRSADEVW